MKISIASIEATPSEIADVPEVRELLARLGTGIVEQKAIASKEQTANGDVDVWHFLELRGRRNPQIDLVRDFLLGCLEFDGAEPVVGRSRNSPDGYGDYVMVRHVSHIKGAFVYVTPSNGKLHLRVRREAAEGRQHAIPIDTTDENYQVRVYLKSHEDLKDALELAKLAYDGVTP